MPLHFICQPSPRLAMCLAALSGGALACVLLSDAPEWLKTLAAGVCLLHTGYTIRRYALLVATQSIVECTLLSNGLWQLKNRAGEEQLARLLGDSWCSRLALILNFKCEPQQKRLSVLLISSMLKPKPWRHLQAYLHLPAKAHV